jgi:hypothetical protein
MATTAFIVKPSQISPPLTSTAARHRNCVPDKLDAVAAALFGRHACAGVGLQTDVPQWLLG